MECVLGDVPANIDKIREFCGRAKREGAELIVFPEMSDTGYRMDVIRECATDWNRGAVPALKQTARELSLAIICGVSERDGDCIYNSQAMIDSRGELIAKYRKTHLFSPAPVEEHTCFTAGDELVAQKIENLSVGLSICYDLRFPELFRVLACEKGANVFAMSSAWPFPRLEHFRTLCMARAIENQSYMIAANRVGTDVRVTFCGSSMIVDPAGAVIAAAVADREQLIYADIHVEDVDVVRQRMPVFADRREQLYRG